MELSAVNTMLKNRRRVYLEPIWNVLEDTMHEPIEGLSRSVLPRLNKEEGVSNREQQSTISFSASRKDRRATSTQTANTQYRRPKLQNKGYELNNTSKR